MKSSNSPLIVLSSEAAFGEYIRVTPKSAGWEHLSFAARHMQRGEKWDAQTEQFEYGLVVLGGVCSVSSSRGNWPMLGRRKDVFSGMPYGLYLPPETRFSVRVESEH